jgi:hypothetical protein
MNELQKIDLTGSHTHDRTRTSVLRQLALLQTLSLEELREQWLDLYGAAPPQYKAAFLRKRLAFRIQELFYGGLADAVKAQLAQVAQRDPVATVHRRIPEERKAPTGILPGTRLVRIWRDQRHEVSVQADGYEYDGRTFRSLSAVAKAITGTQWNGKVFFGLKKAYGQPAAGGAHAR